MPKKADAAGELRRVGQLEYRLVRRRVKNLNLHLQRDGTVQASAAPSVPAARVDAFVAAHEAWVRQGQRRLQSRAEAEAALPLPDRAQALAQLCALSDRVFPCFAQVLDGQKPRIKVRDMCSRWGVCVPQKRQITFALRLVQMPLAAQEYVVVHEYCHFLVPNHSPAFWAQVERLLPDWKARRALLRGLPGADREP